MRRLRLSVPAFVVAVAAALIPGAAVLAQPANCPAAPTAEQFAAMVHDANLILIGTVSRTAADAANSEGGTVWVRPEAFLKGNPSAAEIAFSTGLPGPCAASSVTAGDRLLLVARSGDGLTPLPGPERLYRLADGVARSLNRGDSSAIIESEFVARVRALTNQYAVPASSSSEGASIDWTGTILPVGAALAAIFVVALVLMRTWHRIDPS